MSILGTRVTRVEDPDLLTVGGKYVDDLAPADAVHAVFVRSEMAHAEIAGIDVSEAIAAPGVVAVFTAADLELPANPPAMPMLNQEMLRTRLATDRVRYVGEPIAVVIADSLTEGVDAAEHGVRRLRAAARGRLVRPTRWRTRRCCSPTPVPTSSSQCRSASGDDFFDGCEVTVELAFRNHRLAPCPLEPRATVARWETDDGCEHLTQWSTTQGAHGTRDTLAAAIGVEPDQVRVICPDVGGGFGAKNGGYPEDIVVAAGRPPARTGRCAGPRPARRACSAWSTVAAATSRPRSAAPATARDPLPGPQCSRTAAPTRGRLGPAVHHPDHGHRACTTSPTSTSPPRRWSPTPCRSGPTAAPVGPRPPQRSSA